MTVHEPMPPLRASDADREATVDRLRTAAIEGRLTADELDERLSAAYRARLCSELDRLVADVTPPPKPALAARPRPAPPARRVNRLAVASAVVAVFWGWTIGAVAAIVMGHLALRQIARSGGAEYGRLIAIAGLTLGYLAVLTPLLLGGFADWIWP